MVLEMFPGLKLMLGVEREPSHIIAVAIATAPKPSKVTLVPTLDCQINVPPLLSVPPDRFSKIN